MLSSRNGSLDCIWCLSAANYYSCGKLRYSANVLLYSSYASIVEYECFCYILRLCERVFYLQNSLMVKKRH